MLTELLFGQRCEHQMLTKFLFCQRYKHQRETKNRFNTLFELHMDREMDSSSLEKFCVHPSFSEASWYPGYKKTTRNDVQYRHTLDFHKFSPSDKRFCFEV